MDQAKLKFEDEPVEEGKQQERRKDNANNTRTYTSLRQEVKRDLEHLFPNAVILTLKQAAKAYGYTDTQTAKERIGAPRIPGERRVVYYLGDIASDIAKRRLG